MGERVGILATFFPFQGLGAVGPEVGRRFSAFWVVRKAVFLCLHALVRILASLPFGSSGTSG